MKLKTTIPYTPTVWLEQMRRFHRRRQFELCILSPGRAKFHRVQADNVSARLKARRKENQQPTNPIFT